MALLNTARRVTLDSLPDADRPIRLLPLNKTLCDAVKRVAYRAETALVALLRNAALLTDLNQLNFCHRETGDSLVYSLV